MQSVPSKSALSKSRRRLVEFIQRINFGSIVELPIRGGEPVLEPQPKSIVDYKFCGATGPRRELALDDFLLKAQVVDLFRQIDQMGDGVIDVLQVQNGLPFLMRVSNAA